MGKRKVEKSRIEKDLEKEEKTFASMSKKIIVAIKGLDFICAPKKLYYQSTFH